MATKPLNVMTQQQPLISKLYCSPYETILLVRRRPKVANGGGFAVADAGQSLIFAVDGCGIIGRKDELVLRDGDGNALLLIRHTGGIIEALTLSRKWKGFSYESSKLVFTLREPNSCCSSKSPIRISAGSKTFEVRGDFSEGSCAIVDAAGQLIAQIGVKISVDLYHLRIMPGIDQAFVVGVIAVLDYVNGGSTRC
ncbi:protein LURP-one-related 6-like [Andrographis paniculata]|uniref:protein LURP-one-related 6-like n=1 Tax=Andrographis paniculata TaxID=175694 RepID=UPI0021E8DB67|nr:protein LURP-one-related 6-like [Andrographis paniculata]